MKGQDAKKMLEKGNDVVAKGYENTKEVSRS